MVENQLLLDITSIILASICVGLFLINKYKRKVNFLQIILLIYALAVLVTSVLDQW